MAARRWLEERRPFLRRRSVEAYGHCIKILIRYLGSRRISLSHLTALDAQRFFAWMFSEGYAYATVRLCRRTLGTFLHHLSLSDARGRFSTAVIRQARLPREPRTMPLCLTKDQCARVLAYLKRRDRCIYLICLMAYLTGMRISEILSLKISDIDLNARTIFIGAEQKNGAACRIPFVMHPDMLAYIRFRRSLALGTDTLFIGRTFMPIGISSVQTRVRRISRELGIRFHMHAFRHSIASHLAGSGTPMPSVQRFLRHLDMRTTMRYITVFPENIQRDIESAHPLAI
ncbi:MAG: tyrosine-type recombinase/integrase [Spirochaetota bacterium]